jgi:hypothetical protein
MLLTSATEASADLTMDFTLLENSIVNIKWTYTKIPEGR